MRAPACVAAVRSVLAPLADAARAPAMRAYMRDQFDFLGVATPARRAAVQPILRSLRGAGAETLLACADSLWALPQREYQYVAIDLLARHRKQLATPQLEALFALAQRKAWWDSVDGLAGVVGDLVRADRAAAQPRMDAALAHPDLWLRRIAMLHQLGWRGDTDVRRLFAYADRLAAEPDFFLRKAIGWALRDYARHDPAAVRGYLAARAGTLSPLTLREAAKHLG